jgi:rubrerythrin
MSLAKTFYLLKDAELRTGELYATISLTLAITQPGLSDLFSAMAEEERLHSQQVELMRNIFLDSKDAFLENPEAEKAVGDFLKNLESIRCTFIRDFAQMQPQDVIHAALDVERHLVESHSTFFIEISDESVKKLFAGLNSGNEAHIQKLETFLPG